MKARLAIGSLAALIVGAALVAGCSGGGDDGGGNQVSEIRTNKGLSVAAVGAQFQASGERETDDVAGAPAVDPAPGWSRGVERAAPDIGFAPGPLQQSLNGITVQGYGSATASADSAVVEFYFGQTYDGVEPPDMPVPEPRSEPGAGGGVSTDVIEAMPVPAGASALSPVSQQELQPVIDAIVAQGVSPDDIEFIGSFDPYYRSATLLVTVRNMDAVGGVVQAGTDAAAGLGDVSLHGTNVSYTISDCAPLERAAMQAATEDARDRAAAFAQVLGTGLGGVLGAANYSYAPYGGSSCSSMYYGPYPGVWDAGFASGQEVEVFATVTITYAIQ